MNEKHAYLIMAHNDFSILVEILKELDHERNEIFLHIDKKTSDFPENEIREAVKFGKLDFIPSMNVSWGGYSQIECELRLMKYAISKGDYAYYHMFTGSTFPLKRVDEILDFFDRHSGFEFIGYDDSDDYSGRVKRYNIFNEVGKATTKVGQLKSFCRNKFRGLQKRIGYVYKPAKGLKFKKGFAYWSLTENAVKYVLKHCEEIERLYKHSFCGDELFVHTIIYNSPFKEKIYNCEKEYESCLRFVKPVQSWKPQFSGSTVEQTKRPESGIGIEDIKECVGSNMLFGLKFVGKTGLEAIEYLRELRRVDINK